MWLTFGEAAGCLDADSKKKRKQKAKRAAKRFLFIPGHSSQHPKENVPRFPLNTPLQSLGVSCLTSSPPARQANETFAFVGNVTRYAQVWLNISAEIRGFLEEGKLQQRIAWLQQVLGGDWFEPPTRPGQQGRGPANGS